MKILIFGTGMFYRNRKEKIPKGTEIAGFLDNDSALWGTCIDGVQVYPPKAAAALSYDIVVLCSAKADEMEAQLTAEGIEKSKIWCWNRFYSFSNRGNYHVYGSVPPQVEKGKNVLIITQHLGYHGGAMAAIYAAMVLMRHGFSVILAAPEGNEKLIGETIDPGITVVIAPELFYVHSGNMTGIDRFDVVLVNVYPMIQCACEISRIKPVLWWIHENSAKYDNTYPTTRKMFSEYDCLNAMERVNAVAVSKIAQENFNHYYPEKIKNTLAYGIPDMGEKGRGKKNTDKLIFAIVGGICIRKAQHVFIKALQQLNDEDLQKAEFWIIGGHGDNSYYQDIKAAADKIPQIKILGEMTREELDAAYQEIDVVVCPSMEDCLPIVMTEGMMYGKCCIASDATGTSDYIEDGRNGFICKAGSISSLCKKMHHIISNREQLEDIGQAARKTYEEYFALEKFGEQLKGHIMAVIQNHPQKRIT